MNRKIPEKENPFENMEQVRGALFESTTYNVLLHYSINNKCFILFSFVFFFFCCQMNRNVTQK